MLNSGIPLALSWEPTARLASLHIHALRISLRIHHNLTLSQALSECLL
ncbi:hypothetical protein J4Z08_20400 [Citrobacter portucalensis]